jgi:hypothetical protein
MRSADSIFITLDDDLERELHHYHPAAQVRRALGVFVSTMLLQLWTSGATGWTWKGGGSIALAAAYATYRQLSPTIPFATVSKVVLQGGSDLPKPKPPARPTMDDPGG